MTFLEFCQSLMATRFSQPSSPEQLEYMQAVESVITAEIDAGRVLELRSLPRGQGTSTILIAAACWCLKVREEPYVVVYGPDPESVLMSIAGVLDLDYLDSLYRQRRHFVRIEHLNGAESLCAAFRQSGGVPLGLCEKINGKSQRPTVLIVDEQNYVRKSLNPQNIKRLKAVVPIGATIISRPLENPDEMDSEAEEDGECFRDEWEIEWEQFQHSDLIVKGHKQAGASDAQIACALARMNHALVDRIMKLEAIAPRRIRLADGTALVWRCPDELVPDLGLEGSR